MRYLIYLCLYLALTLMLACCTRPQVIHQAPDYGPVAEAFKFVGLCLLGISVVAAVAVLLKQLIQK